MPSDLHRSLQNPCSECCGPSTESRAKILGMEKMMQVQDWANRADWNDWKYRLGWLSWLKWLKCSLLEGTVVIQYAQFQDNELYDLVSTCHNTVHWDTINECDTRSDKRVSCTSVPRQWTEEEEKRGLLIAYICLRLTHWRIVTHWHIVNMTIVTPWVTKFLDPVQAY